AENAIRLAAASHRLRAGERLGEAGRGVETGPGLPARGRRVRGRDLPRIRAEPEGAQPPGEGLDEAVGAGPGAPVFGGHRNLVDVDLLEEALGTDPALSDGRIH